MINMEKENISPYKIACELEEKNIPFAWVTLCDYTGVVTRKTGRMLVKKNGTSYGTIGGGVLEHKAIEKAKKSLNNKQGGLFTLYNDDEVKSSSIIINIDVGESSSKVIIIGGGHVGRSVAEVASKAGFQLIVIDKREDIATPSSFPMASDIIINDNISTAIKEIDTNNSSILVLNHTLMNKKDYITALRSKAQYVGVMTSHRHMYSFIEDLKLTSEENLKLHIPIGLNTGGETPYQVALSIVSEVISFQNNNSPIKRKNLYRPIIVRGAGDLATATILKLHRLGFKVIALEVEKPTVIRRTISFAQAMYDESFTVEGATAVKCDKNNLSSILKVLQDGNIAVVSDKEGSLIEKIKPLIVVDAILAKKNLGTRITDAPLVIALGPGFQVGKDCHFIVETKRGHFVGNVIREGMAIENTGIPGIIGGYGKERVIHSPVSGTWQAVKQIGDIVKKDDIIAKIDETLILATIDGKLRGSLKSGLKVPVGFKVADIDPRGEDADHLCVSDKGRNIAGGVLTIIFEFLNKN